MPSKVDRLLVSTITREPSAHIVYTEAVTPDSYSRGLEDDHTILFVHPMHRIAVEAAGVHVRQY